MRGGLLGIVLAIGALPSLFPVQASNDPARTLIVEGRLENTGFKHEDRSDDLIGHGWVTAKLHIRRTVRGRSPASVLSVRYFAHTYMREDRTFRFHLRRGSGGTYVIEGARSRYASARLRVQRHRDRKEIARVPRVRSDGRGRDHAPPQRRTSHAEAQDHQ